MDSAGKFHSIHKLTFSALSKRHTIGAFSVINFLHMFFNHIKIAWRNILKTKGYAAINIGGLCVGIAITMLIGLWLWDELSFNKYHENYDRIAQIMNRGNFNGQRFAGTSVQLPLEKVLRNTYGNQFKHIVLSRYWEEHILT